MVASKPGLSTSSCMKKVRPDRGLVQVRPNGVTNDATRNVLPSASMTVASPRLRWFSTGCRTV